MNKFLKLIKGKKTYIGAGLIAVGTFVTLPASLPVWTASAFIYAGTALGGAGIFDKVNTRVQK